MSTAAIDDPRVVNLSQEDIEMDEEYEHDEREWGDLLVGLEQEKEPSVRWGAQARNDDLMEQLTDDPELLDEDDREYREAQRRGLKRPAEKIAGSRRAKKKVKKVKKSSKNEKRKESKSKGSKDKEAPAKEAKKKKKKDKKDDSSTSAESTSSDESDSASSTSSSSSSSSSSSDEPRKKRKKKASRKKDKLPARIAKAVGDVLMVTAPNDPSSRQVRDLTEIVSLLQEGRIRKGIQRLEGRIALIKAAQGSDERLAALEASAIAQKLAGASNPTSAAIAAVGSFVPRQARMRPRYPQQPRQQTQRAGEKCFGCGMEGHRVRECRQKAP